MVVQGLRMCVEKTTAPSGTGKAARVPGLDVIGKTGTAQVISLAGLEEYGSVEDIPYEKRHHAWFVAGVLNKTPRIAVSILIEHGHSGGEAAAPVAKDVIEYFYGIPQEEPAKVAANTE